MVTVTWFNVLWENEPGVGDVLLDFTGGAGDLDLGGGVLVQAVFSFQGRQLGWLRQLPRLGGGLGISSGQRGWLEGLDFGNVQVGDDV